MIYTVTLNPSLDYVVEIPKLVPGTMNRTQKELVLAGGKGINVSYALHQLGYESIASGFIAGRTGRMLLDMLHQSFIKTDFIEVYSGMTRINIKVQSDVETEINGSGPFISEEELKVALRRIETLSKEDILILSGSLPNGVPANFYYEFITLANKMQCECILDSSGEAFKYGLQAKPYLVKPNRTELGELFQTKVETVEEAIEYAKKLQDLGPSNVIVSLGKDGGILLCEDGRIYKGSVPDVQGSSVGAGDSLVAGLVSELVNGTPLEKAFLSGLAMGSATANTTGIANKFEMERMLPQVKVERI